VGIDVVCDLGIGVAEKEDEPLSEDEERLIDLVLDGPIRIERTASDISYYCDRAMICVEEGRHSGRLNQPR
jgi:hypothetical protein